MQTMVDAERKVLNGYQWRARLPRYLRIGAVAAAGIAVLVILVGFFNARSRSPFKLRSEHTRLSTEVTAEVSGYERLESDNGIPQYLIKADFAKTYSDNHQELSNVYLEVFNSDGAPADKLSAASALYIPEEAKAFTAYLNGNVNIETRDRLKVKTNNLIYTRKTDVADADELIEFERGGVKGRSFGAAIRIGEQKIELLRDVEVETLDSSGGNNGTTRSAKVKAGYASFDQKANLIEFRNGLTARLSQAGDGTATDMTAGSAIVTLIDQGGTGFGLKGIELTKAVRIVSATSNRSVTTIESAYASYDSPTDRFDLKGGLRIVSDQAQVTAGEGLYARTAGTLTLTGSVEIVQGNDRISGNTVQAALGSGNKLKSAVVRGDASITRTAPERRVSLRAPELNAEFGDSDNLLSASAVGQSTFEIVSTDQRDFVSISGAAGRGIGAAFGPDGIVDAIRTDGPTTIDLNARNADPDSANKRLTADAVRTTFGGSGDLSRAEAAGDAQLEVIPLNAGPQAFRTTVTAPRFDCDFFPTGNIVDVCVATRRVKATRAPTAPSQGRGTQSLTSDRLTAKFNERSGDVATLTASGNAKFSELDRNGSSAEITFTQADETVRLRGGEPGFWNDSGRAKAREIDIDTRGERSYLRGNVSTTYYSLKRAGSAVPFASGEKPVFVTSETAEFDHAHESGIYRGNARAWQANNYVRAESIFMDEKDGRLKADGRVESALYNAKLGGRSSSVPVFASSGSLTYQRDERILRYRTAVDIRQGTDRLTTAAADIYLDEHNDVAKTIAQNDVILAQPGRRATGDWAEFNAAEEVAIIRGEPARIVDAEGGSTQGREMTFRLKENKVAIESRPRTGNAAGRTRSVYKVTQ